MKVLTKNTKIENIAKIYNRVAGPILIGLILLATAVLYASSASAQASNVYITPDGGGSGVCTNNTHPPSWFNNSGNWGNGSAQIGPGTVVHLCGSFTDSTANDTLLSFQGSGTPGHPITLLFESGTTLTNTSYWNDYSGAIVSDGKTDITVDGGTNGLIQNTGNGSAFPNKHDTKGLVIRNCSNCVIKNLHVDNLYVHIPGTSASSPGEDGPSPNGIATGIECAGCTNSVLGPNNEAHDDFAGISYNWEHTSGRNMEIYGNTVSRNNWGILAAGQSGGIDGLKIHDNDISDAFPWDDWFNGNHHNGIMVFEVGPSSTISNLQQYNNYIHGDMGDICVDGLSHTTAFIFNDYNGGTWVAPLLFNNVLVNTNPNCGPGNGMLTVVSTSGSGGIYNNTFAGRGAAINLTGNPFVIKNNIFTKIDLGILNQKGTIGATDYNLFYGLTGADHAPGAVMVDHNSSINFYSTIAQWITSSGFDSHASTANPNLTANFRLGSGSGAVSGTNLSSLGIAALNVDRAGNPRPTSGSWNQGAYQGGSTSGSAPTPPTNLTVVVH